MGYRGPTQVLQGCAGRASVWSAGACSRFRNAAKTERAPRIPERQRQQVGALQTLARGNIVRLRERHAARFEPLHEYGRKAARFHEASVAREAFHAKGRKTPGHVSSP